jgi:type I restriction enzyme, S subunit
VSLGRYQAYPEYRESGLGWLREIPAHWETKRLKYLGEAIIGLTYSPDDVVDETEGTLVLRSSNVQSRELAFEDNVYVKGVVPPKLRTRKGDILICSRNGSRALIGKNAQIDNRAEGLTFGAFMTVFRSPLNAYLSKVFNSSLFEYQSGSFLTSTINQLTTGTLNDFEVPLPPLPEQTQIAKFLDHETAKIDRLIEKQEALIRLLKEKRQAVISHAVTKGLNPHAPLKDSGIAWLGQVPAHWSIKPLKYLMSLTSGGTPSKDNIEYWEGTVPWASSKDLKSDELFDTQDYITQKALDRGAAELVPTGSILTVVRGMILLHTFPISVTRVPMAINQDLKAIQPTAGISTDFLAWLLRGSSDVVLSTTDEAGHGTKVLRMESWLAIQVPIPPLEEQALIVTKIVKRLGQLDELTEDAHRAVTLLQERRTALISAAVTGKIDVRHWQPPVGSILEPTESSKIACFHPENRFNPSPNV